MVSIILNRPKSHVFSVNELIQGRVEVESSSASQKHNSIMMVDLTFTCISSIKILPEGHWSDHPNTPQKSSSVLLFIRHLRLQNPAFKSMLSSNGAGMEGILSFPFEICIPNCAEAVPPDVAKAYNCQLLQHQDDFPATVGLDPVAENISLPDSLDVFYAYSNERAQINGYVSYSLDALCDPPPDHQGMFICNASQNIPVQNPVSALDKLIVEQQHQVSEFKLTQAPHPAGSIPTQPKTLHVTFTAPSILFLNRPAGEPLPIYLKAHILDTSDALEQNLSPAETTQCPLCISLKQLNIFLRASSSVRATAESSDSSMEDPIETAVQEACIYNGAAPAEGQRAIGRIRLEEDVWFDIGERLGVTWEALERINEEWMYALVGSLVTPNLIRRYMIRWEVKVEVKGEEVCVGGEMPVKLVRGCGEE